LLLFTISDTKRDLYLLPLLPILALFVACYWDALAAERSADGPLSRWITAGLFALLALGGLLVPVARGSSGPMRCYHCCLPVCC
jgi:4-amino-4-deoxy-L-arabinose transferase-like glycosyltransferase